MFDHQNANDDGFVLVDAEELTDDELLEVVGGGCSGGLLLDISSL